MSIFSRKPKQEPETVIITLAERHADARLRPDAALENLIDALAITLNDTDCGDFDIVESTRDASIIHLSGKDGETLFLSIKATLEGLPICEGARVRIEHASTARELTIATNSGAHHG